MRVVLDLSTSLAWRRPPVGIVRAERKFAAFLLQQPRVAVGFCRFDRASRTHVEVPIDVVRRCLGLVGDDVPVVDPSPSVDDVAAVVATNGDRPPLRRRARESMAAAVHRGIARLPTEVQADAAIVVRSGAMFVKGLYWMALRTWRHRVTASAPRGVPEPPAAPPPDAGIPLRLDRDDVYVSMGLDWEYNDLAALCELKRRQGFRSVLYCYDLIPVRFPQLMSFDARQPFSRYFADVAHVADHVVAISRASLEDFREFLLDVGAPVPPLSVIHLGTDIAHGAGDEAVPRAELGRTPFVLCVGTIEARKNHELLYNVWDRLTAVHGDRTPLLVLVGMVGWGVHDLLLRMKLNRRVADRVLVLQEVADDALVWLYEHCLFTVYPSLFEGWGLPVVESMALGKPCVASSALAEASGGLVPTLDPLDFAAWLGQVERWAFDPVALEEATRRLDHYKPPSWWEHGTAMLDLIHGLSGRELCASSI
jgi:glycosyltransferase involved in cell wall biosynthesis